MARRPAQLDLRSESENSMRFPSFSLGDLPSPRTGEIPPALSPLDAFALQSRLLAQRFDEEKKAGRRMSRLPPMVVSEELSHRPGYFRSASGGSESAADDTPAIVDEDTTPHCAIENTQERRPVSHYPLIQSDDGSVGLLSYQQYKSVLAPLHESGQSISEAPGYFGIPRSQSPENFKSQASRIDGPARVPPTLPYSTYPPQQTPSVPRKLTVGSTASYGLGNLAPPRSPGLSRSPRVTPSIRSVAGDSSDDAEGASLSNSAGSLPARDLSSNTSISRSHSPCSPYNAPVQRSPSLSSEHSVSGTGLPRPAFNFSRPISRAGRPSFDTRPSFETRPSFDSRPSFDAPSRQASGSSANMRPSFEFPTRKASGNSQATSCSEDSFHTSASVCSEDYVDAPDSEERPGTSYIYASYSLPRGKRMERESIDAKKFLSSQFQSDDQPHPSSSRRGSTRLSLTRPPSPPTPQKIPPSPRQSPQPPRPSPSHSPHPSSPSISSHTTSSTIKARLDRTKPTSAEITPEQHLEKGIQSHESGDLKESTYHLRLAAKAGLPTAMLLYALACRHGWGMRPSPAEGVTWLQKAVDTSQLAVADDEEVAASQSDNFLSRKEHKARFALSIYELGVSYMNGWGTKMDKGLALRCFEIAGNWGDPDALAEAGYCYAEGVGCRKDLVKAARLYRAAAEKGVSMTGNSWIYKEKYMDKADDDRGRAAGRKLSNAEKKKPRDKSRTRTIFGRKKSTAA
ncbi:hypothetical protein W97_03568 [Coniosporium apollinis CBS 100218]|uniref:Cell cycle inhibitor Nif1 n=1 Tax=Coniosporium apollinis (strain CBS 100218) TaxID=1168221 RepID=R7YQZ6_CONA1|nr:uncharacterized protein W97_03568 [Coniosporium apollinis CBS 100218]EON64337.1 hypothetical protein W97_03568 [Coniosporium apollinis CBS 100218]